MKNERIVLRSNSDEKKEIFRSAKKAKMSVSKFLITSALSVKIIVKNGSDEERKKLVYLSSLSNNINQIARSLNIIKYKKSFSQEDISVIEKCLNLIEDCEYVN